MAMLKKEVPSVFPIPYARNSARFVDSYASMLLCLTSLSTGRQNQLHVSSFFRQYEQNVLPKTETSIEALSV